MSQSFKQPPSRLDRAGFLQVQGRVYEHSPWIAEALWSAGLKQEHDQIDALHRDLAAIVDAAPRERQLALLNAHPDLAGHGFHGCQIWRGARAVPVLRPAGVRLAEPAAPARHQAGQRGPRGADDLALLQIAPTVLIVSVDA